VELRLAAVYAHPDDDTYSSGGVLALERDRVHATILVLTSGESGMISDPSLAAREHLGRVREQEERDALSALGASDADARFLRYADGALAEVPAVELEARIAEELGRARPHVVVTFGPEGITRHPDHVAVHRAATGAFHRARAEAVGGPAGAAGEPFQRLFYVALPQTAVVRWFRTLASEDVHIGGPDDPFMPRGVPDETITHAVDCSSVIERKRAALRVHRTQAAELEAIPEQVAAQLLATEWFVQAWPPPEAPGGRPKHDLFDGVTP
jgi:LmbE family N-acetylglucosaminyl deacetylase